MDVGMTTNGGMSMMNNPLFELVPSSSDDNYDFNGNMSSRGDHALEEMYSLAMPSDEEVELWSEDVVPDEVKILKSPIDVLSEKGFLKMLRTRASSFNTPEDMDCWRNLLLTMSNKQKFDNLANYCLTFEAYPIASSKTVRISVVGDSPVFAQMTSDDFKAEFQAFVDQLRLTGENGDVLFPEVLMLTIENFSLMFFGVGFSILSRLPAGESRDFKFMWCSIVSRYSVSILDALHALDMSSIALRDVCLYMRDGVMAEIRVESPLILSANRDWATRFRIFVQAVLDGIHLNEYIRDQGAKRFENTVAMVKMLGVTMRQDRERSEKMKEENRRLTNIVAAVKSLTFEEPEFDPEAGPAKSKKRLANRQ